MSTVSKRPKKTSRSSDRKTKTRNNVKALPGAASFDYGWRDVEKTLADGRVEWERVPLTLEDVLHPQYGDAHVLSKPHNVDCKYLADVLEARLSENPRAVVLSDTGIYWDDPKLRHHSPDIAVILGVRRQKDWESFYVALDGVRPVLIIEVTSPRTRTNDLSKKVTQYAQAGVPHYVIAVAEEGKGKRRRLKLLAYRLESGAYQPVALEDGRVWLDAVGLWLAVKVNGQTGGDRLALVDPETETEIGDYTAITQSLEAAEAALLAAKEHAAEAQAQAAAARKQAAAARNQAAAAKKQVQAAMDRANAEAQARSAADARVRELEQTLRRLQNPD
ncbi:MAG: Uma2 family endonuclease [Isosphaeraceae bacterium]